MTLEKKKDFLGLLDLMHFHNIARFDIFSLKDIWVLLHGQKPWLSGNEFHNLSRGFYEHHSNIFV